MASSPPWWCSSICDVILRGSGFTPLFSPQLLGEDRFQDIEKIKTIGSTYMAVSGLSPEKQVSPRQPGLPPLTASARAHTALIRHASTFSRLRDVIHVVQYFNVTSKQLA